jgi:hypothetical protein
MEIAAVWINPLDTQEGRLAADVLSFPWLATRFAKCPGRNRELVFLGLHATYMQHEPAKVY